MVEKDVFNRFWAFVNLEKAYDTIDRHGMLQMTIVYGIGGKFMKAVHSFYVDSWACPGGWEIMIEMFPVNVGLR